MGSNGRIPVGRDSNSFVDQRQLEREFASCSCAPESRRDYKASLGCAAHWIRMVHVPTSWLAGALARNCQSWA